MKKLLWSSTAGLALLGLVSGAVAQETTSKNADKASKDEALPPMSVSATRGEKSLDEVPATVRVITDREIDENLVTDIKDLVRFEPGVSVRSSPSRFGAALASTGRDGNSGFNIRGLEGNRVLIQVDGIRVPDGFSFGPAAFGRGDYVDLDLLKSVEIVRGPTSALYGSDGLTGSVSYVTKDPADFLDEGDSYGGRARLGYSSADESWTKSVIGAVRDGRWSALAAYTLRDGHELDNMGEISALNTTRTDPNPQDAHSRSALGRIVFEPSALHRFRLTFDNLDREVTTEAYSGRAAPPLVASSVIDLDGLDELSRARVSVDHAYDNPGQLVEHIDWNLYYQESEAREFSAEDRNVSVDRTRDTNFDNRVWGFGSQFETPFSFAGIAQRLTYGGDYSNTYQEALRSGLVPPFGETFPTRPFPNTKYVQAGGFVQDEIPLLDGKLTLSPALRLDYYSLDPEADALYPLAASASSDTHLSPKIGMMYWPVERFGLFANLASGFKAPAPSQVNNSFTNIASGYTSIANPDLTPETSKTVEAGARLRDVDFLGAVWSGSGTGFTGRYKDFISQETIATSPLLTFQYVNLSEVVISGGEAKLEANWASGFGLIASAAYTRGDVIEGGEASPLASVDPLKFVTGLTYRDPAGRFGGQAILTYSGGKEDNRTGACSSPTTGLPTACFAPPGFAIVDLTAYWNLTPAATLNIGFFNVTDETYWWWGDVRGQAASSSVTDAYTQPGRNASISLSYRF